ncbi:N-acyl-D-amino-acid deacylase family protein [Geodermatophilus sp. CPCC 206100]|uniref:N-acyl-D-amino-acid deacylase family protein n=1 Tax=Geodermatophilus sp. CPCC 206100 TaxID=3020054 RepID=UPI003B004DA3
MSPRTLLRDALVVDGTGAPARAGDVLVEGDRIAAVEPPGLLSGDGAAVRELGGAVLCPGFVDVHSHADNAPLLAEDDQSKITQGVTTEVVGNCGFSLAPISAAHRDDLQGLMSRIFPAMVADWSTFPELFATLDGAGYVTNYAPLVGHHSLRVAAMGMADGAPDADQLAAMRHATEQALEAGAFGLSTGLIYPPGLFARDAEIQALAEVMPADRPYVTHMRGEGRMLLDSISEAIRIAEGSGRPLQVSHLKAAGRAVWGRMGEALALLDAARDRGVDVTHDVYPYLAGSTMLTATLPPWFQEGGNPSVLRRLEEPASLERLRRDIEADDGDWENHVTACGWGGIVVASTRSHTHDGKSIQQIAEETGADPLDALVDVLRAEELEASMIIFSMREEDLVEALAHPLTMVGSDGLPPGGGGRPHPRMWGTFPRVLARYVRETGLLSLEEAVRKMTSLPARRFGLADRGEVRAGAVADLVVLDPATVQDEADYADPVRPASGVLDVLVGGTVVVDRGSYVGTRAGRRLAPSS